MNSTFNWMNPKYLEAIEQGRICEYLLDSAPFPVAVFPDFLSTEAYQILEERSSRVETSCSVGNVGAARKAKIEWGPFVDSESLRFFYGRDFRRMLKMLFGDTFSIRKNWVPQLAHMHAGSSGFICHNDRDEPRDAVALLYLTPELPDGGGGSLQVHDRDQVVVHQIRPEKNTLVLFEVSDQSWHSTEDMKGNWVRRNLLFDWDRVRT